MDRIGVPRVGRACLAAAVLLALVVPVAGFGCGSDDGSGDDSAPAAADTNTSTTPPERAFSDFEELDAGRKYETAVFKPAMQFQLPPGGWISETGDTLEHFAIAAIDPPAPVKQAIVAAHRMEKNSVYPTRGGRQPGDAVPLDGEFIDWLREHPHLRTTAPKSVTLMGLPGEQVEVTTKSSPPVLDDECYKVGEGCVPLFYDGLDSVMYAKSNRGRFTALKLPDGGELVIEEFVEPAKAFKDGLEILRPLVKQLQLAEG